MLFGEIDKKRLNGKADLSECLFRDTLSIVYPEISLSVITGDPDDNRVLESASATQAEAIISGDAHLLDPGQWNGIPVLTPAAFLMEFFAG